MVGRSDAAGGGRPIDLGSLITRLGYKPGWRFRIGGPLNGYLCAQATTPDSLHPERLRTTQHMFALPDVQTEAEFLRWAFDRLLEAEFHEAAEFFQVGDRRPFFPNHQDEGSPYELVIRPEE